MRTPAEWRTYITDVMGGEPGEASVATEMLRDMEALQQQRDAFRRIASHAEAVVASYKAQVAHLEQEIVRLKEEQSVRDERRLWLPKDNVHGVVQKPE